MIDDIVIDEPATQTRSVLLFYHYHISFDLSYGTIERIDITDFNYGGGVKFSPGKCAATMTFYRPPEMEKRGATIGYLAPWNTVTLLHCYFN